MLLKHLTLAFVFTAVAVMTQGQTGSPSDTSAINRLNVLKGKWSSVSDTKNTRFSQAVHTTATTTCEWSADHQFLVCDQVVKKEEGVIHDLAIFSYDQDKQRYIYAEVDSHGNMHTSRLMILGNTWVYSDEFKQDDKLIEVKVTNEFVIFDRIKFNVEISDDGGKNWILTMQGEENRVENGAGYFKLDLKNEEKLGNIFSRTISYKSDHFPEIVKRVSGTGIYTVVDTNSERPVFEGVFRYDGRPESTARVEFRDSGKTVIYDGKPFVNTDASGLLYNPLIWGQPRTKVKTGDRWTIDIPQAWELGGPGSQVITVICTDESENTIRLMREGSGEGFYDSDKDKIDIIKDGKTITMVITPGQSHWIGYTTFKNGLVVSDELMVTRPVVLTFENLRFEASEREYILLNEMPVF